MIRLLGLLVVMAGLLSALFVFFKVEAPLPQADAETITLGRITYANHCATCHGKNGEGQPGWATQSTPEKPLAPPHDATGHMWEHADRAIFRYIKTGVLDAICTFPGNNGMPQFINVLSDKEIKATIAYIVSTWPKQLQNTHEAINREYNAQDDLLSAN